MIILAPGAATRANSLTNYKFKNKEKDNMKIQNKYTVMGTKKIIKANISAK